jgi:hypothetical protein
MAVLGPSLRDKTGNAQGIQLYADLPERALPPKANIAPVGQTGTEIDLCMKWLRGRATPGRSSSTPIRN